MQAIQNAYATGVEIYEKATQIYNQTTDQLDQTVQKLVPDSLKPLVSKVVHAIPETLFCVALFTNVARPLTTLFWIGKTIYVIFPLVKTIAIWHVAKEDTDAAFAAVKERFTNQVNTMKPALFTSCTAMGVFAGVFGLMTTSLELVKQGALFGMMGYIFYQSINFEVANQNLNHVPAAASTG